MTTTIPRKRVVIGGVASWVEDRDAIVLPSTYREALGRSIRKVRSKKNLTLRDVSKGAIALGYLSEIERGTKEPSSEVLHAVATKLDLTLPDLLRMTADELEGKS